MRHIFASIRHHSPANENEHRNFKWKLENADKYKTNINKTVASLSALVMLNKNAFFKFLISSFLEIVYRIHRK